MNAPRKPAAFKIDSDGKAKKPPQEPITKKKRKPRTIRERAAVSVSINQDDPFNQDIAELDKPHENAAKRRGLRLGALFVGAFGLLLSLAIGLWVEGLIAEFFARAEWLGWVASGLAALAGLALMGIAVREISALFRLRSVEKLQIKAAEVSSHGDIRAARNLLRDLDEFTRSNPVTANGRRALDDLRDEVIDADDLIAIAERELFSHLDQQAKGLVLQSAKRVSVITAVSPRALIDIGYVLFESGRLIRRLSELYGGRPGTLGFVKLVRDVAAHLAVTGSIAIGDSLVQQLVGHGLAAKLSARLGEGVVNGLMTVRIGIAAMETARPLPFNAVKRPGIGEFLSALAGSTPDNRADDKPATD